MIYMAGKILKHVHSNTRDRWNTGLSIDAMNLRALRVGMGSGSCKDPCKLKYQVFHFLSEPKLYHYFSPSSYAGDYYLSFLGLTQN